MWQSWAALPSAQHPDQDGLHAFGYMQGEQDAIDLAVKKAIALDMQVYSDLAGNIYMVQEGCGENRQTDVIVSHLDTVEKGGAHDGRDGIAAGLAVAEAFQKSEQTHPNDLCIMIARTEESDVYGQVSIGAKAALGTLKPEALDRLTNRINGQTLGENMAEHGIEVTQLHGVLEAGPTLFPTGDVGKSLIGQLIEAHIEQGRYCAQQDINVGIVTGIRGNTRLHGNQITGEYAHSGATHESDRADVNRAYAKLVSRLDDWFTQKQAAGHDIVFTAPTIDVPNQSKTTIPGEATFSLEIRTVEPALREEFDTKVREIAADIETENQSGKLKFTIAKPNYTDPAIMDSTLAESAQNAADTLHISAGKIISGAGHDTAQFANAGIPGIMLFIKQDEPISHNPKEAHNQDSFRDTCRIMAQMVANPPQRQQTAETEHDSLLEYLKAQGAKTYRPAER